MITEIGQRADGTYIGEDENGTLYDGVRRMASWDEVTRVVTDNGDGTYSLEYKIGDVLIGKGEIDHDPGQVFNTNTGEWEPYTWTPEKRFVVIQDENNVPVAHEQKLPMITWTERGA